jgi:hypothetical protein
MMLADALDGWLAARMFDTARNGRVMALAVAALCFLVAGIGLARMAQFPIGELAPLVGLGTLALLGGAWLIGRRRAVAA